MVIKSEKECDNLNQFPKFLHEPLRHYFEKRIQNTWNGSHILKGKTPQKHSHMFASNDYLNISKHPQLIQAQTDALSRYGNGQMQSAVFLSDLTALQQTCEAQFCEFLNYPSLLLTQSGWSANVGLIQALAKRHLPVYLDFYTHMSFWAGAKSANANPIPFRHNDPESLINRIEKFGAGIIAVDSIYSTYGSISPLRDYVAIAKHYGCLLIVDESHSLGTHGPEGRGLVAAEGLSGDVDIITASLAKAFCGRAGLIATKPTLIEYIRYSSLPAIFSSSLGPHDYIGFSASLDIIKQENWRRIALHQNAETLRRGLNALGFHLYGSTSQIIPILCGAEQFTIQLRDYLEQRDIFGAVFCAPATPKNKSLIRLSINTDHTQDALDSVLNSLSDAKSCFPNLSCLIEQQCLGI